VADWWLEIAGAVLDVEAAATPPAMTMDRAKMRMTNFMIGNLQRIQFYRRLCFCMLE
jgi:hypothetical protein